MLEIVENFSEVRMPPRTPLGELRAGPDLAGESRAGLTNVGALFGKMCGGPPPPPYTVESRIESKNARPIIFWGSMYSIS